MPTKTCQVTVLPDGHACGAVAKRTIVWKDGQTTPACPECALRMAQLAESHGSPLQTQELR